MDCPDMDMAFEQEQPVNRRKDCAKKVKKSFLFEKNKKDGQLVKEWLLYYKRSLDIPFSKLCERLGLKVVWYPESVALSIGNQSHIFCYNGQRVNFPRRFNIQH